MGTNVAHRPNQSSISAPGPVNVTFHHWHNVYIYSRWKLWTAYGAAIALTAIVLFVGSVAIVLNDASYSESFSTIFRIARGAVVSVDIKAEDLDGRDPLPEYLCNARIALGAEKYETDQSISHKHTTTPDAACDVPVHSGKELVEILDSFPLIAF